MKLTFLGTGGGRHTMFTQIRATGGIWIDLETVKFVVDPGPGALVHSQALKMHPEKWNGIIVSHLHPDNCADVNVLLDGMKDEFLVAERHCILPKEKLKEKMDYFPCVTSYHQKKIKDLYPVKHGDVVSIHGMEIKAFRSEHYDPTVGFTIKHPKIKIGYPADGPYYTGQEKNYDGCDVVILNVLAPKGSQTDDHKHMSVDEAILLINRMSKKPKLVILQHFSLWMIRANLWKQAKILQDATKVKVLIAEDFMELDLSSLATKILKKAS